MITKQEIKKKLENDQFPCRIGESIVCYAVSYTRQPRTRYFDVAIGPKHRIFDRKSEVVNFIYKEVNERVVNGRV